MAGKVEICPPSHRIMKRVYSGSGTGTVIVWTLQSDVRFAD